MAKNALGSWASQPDVVEERARKLAGEAYDLALEARRVGHELQFEYWRGVVEGIQGLVDDGTDTPLLKELYGYSKMLQME